MFLINTSILKKKYTFKRKGKMNKLQTLTWAVVALIAIAVMTLLTSTQLVELLMAIGMVIVAITGIFKYSKKNAISRQKFYWIQLLMGVYTLGYITLISSGGAVFIAGTVCLLLSAIGGLEGSIQSNKNRQTG